VLQQSPPLKPMHSMKRTGIKVFGWHLSKTSFPVYQIAQHKDDAPVKKCGFAFCPAYCSHWWNISSKFNGGAIPNIICTAHHRNLA
jgi:hypothetical protein